MRCRAASRRGPTAWSPASSAPACAPSAAPRAGRSWCQTRPPRPPPAPQPTAAAGAGRHDAPAVTIATPAEGADVTGRRPLLSGSAGTEGTDEGSIRPLTGAGSPQTLTAPVGSDGGWSVSPPPTSRPAAGRRWPSSVTPPATPAPARGAASPSPRCCWPAATSRPATATATRRRRCCSTRSVATRSPRSATSSRTWGRGRVQRLLPPDLGPGEGAHSPGDRQPRVPDGRRDALLRLLRVAWPATRARAGTPTTSAPGTWSS